MRSDGHQHARFLIEEAAISGLSPNDECWLHDHLEQCAECSGHSQTTAGMLRGLRSLSFELDPAMTTRVREAAVAYAVRRTASRQRAWLAAAVVTILTAPSIFYAVRSRQPDPFADQSLWESVEANLSRQIPQALEPLASAEGEPQ